MPTEDGRAFSKILRTYTVTPYRSLKKALNGIPIYQSLTFRVPLNLLDCMVQVAELFAQQSGLPIELSLVLGPTRH